MSAENDNQQVKLKCPKCGHEIQEDAGWMKVSSKVTYPVCLTMVALQTQEGDGSTEVQSYFKSG